MNLTPEQKEQGRRNFLKAIAGTPALAALAAASAAQGPKRGGPVKAALIGAGAEGKVLLGQLPRGWIDLRAICDINPRRANSAADGVASAPDGDKRRPTVHEDWKAMLEREDLEAVIIATPLLTHADITVGAIEAGKHVLCEKMMAYDAAGCDRMADAARRAGRVLEIGHQRFYSPGYRAAWEGIIKTGQLGDVYLVRTVWHRNGNWRREEELPAPGYDPRPWGYDTWEHLLNWRLYRKYSHGLMAELGSHQIAVANWFYDGPPEAVYTAGGIHRYRDGREVNDHVFSTFEYSGGRTATFTSIQSNKFDGNYEQIMGTKGTLILRGEGEVYFFGEDDAKPTTIEVTPRDGNAVLDASESRSADAKGRTVAGAGAAAGGGAGAGGGAPNPLIAYSNEIAGFCAAIRTGVPILCGPERARGSALACIKANESADKKARLPVA